MLIKGTKPVNETNMMLEATSKLKSTLRCIKVDLAFHLPPHGAMREGEGGGESKPSRKEQVRDNPYSQWTVHSSWLSQFQDFLKLKNPHTTNDHMAAPIVLQMETAKPG